MATCRIRSSPRSGPRQRVARQTGRRKRL